jgi:hypothetical protein
MVPITWEFMFAFTWNVLVASTVIATPIALATVAMMAALREM